MMNRSQLYISPVMVLIIQHSVTNLTSLIDFFAIFVAPFQKSQLAEANQRGLVCLGARLGLLCALKGNSISIDRSPGPEPQFENSSSLQGNKTKQSIKHPTVSPMLLNVILL